jgi:hypothetical protein
MASRRDLRLEELARRGPLRVWFPGPRWCTSMRLAMCRTAKRTLGRLDAVASSGFRPSRAVCRRLRPYPTVPDEGASAVAPQGEPLEACSTRPWGDMESGDRSPREMNSKYARRPRVSRGRCYRGRCNEGGATEAGAAFVVPVSRRWPDGSWRVQWFHRATQRTEREITEHSLTSRIQRRPRTRDHINR